MRDAVSHVIDHASASGAQPLRTEEFEQLMRPFAPWPVIVGVAVSGGPDSMALALCAHSWAQHHNIKLNAYIVDHALRVESAVEARTTSVTLTALGIDNEILRWEHTAITSRLHQQARQARYRLLADACQRHHVQHLMLAHQREDQAETILMRLAKGSGIDGLSGMSARNQANGINLWRPLLTVPKARLIATCDAAKISYLTDPSNLSGKFARGRLRHVLPHLAAEGLTLERLIDLGNRAATARDALSHYTQIFLRNHVTRDVTGSLTTDRSAFRALPRAIGERVLAALLQHIHAEDYAPEYAALTAVYDSIIAGETMPPRTLHGCIISADQKEFLVTREIVAIPRVSLRRGDTILWDRRWHVTLTPQAPEPIYEVRPLGLPQHNLLDELSPALTKLAPLARGRSALPSLWAGDRLVLIPALISDSEKTSRCHAAAVTEWPPTI